MDDRVKHYHADGRPYTQAEINEWARKASDSLLPKHDDCLVPLLHASIARHERLHPPKRPQGGWPDGMHAAVGQATRRQMPVLLGDLPG